MSEENVAPEAFEDAVDPNKRVKGKQNLRYMVLASVLCAIAGAALWGIGFAPTPAQKAAQNKLDGQTAGHVKAIGDVASMKLSPQGEVASLNDQLNEVKQANGKLSTDNSQLQNQLGMLQTRLDTMASQPGIMSSGSTPVPMIDVRAQAATNRNIQSQGRSTDFQSGGLDDGVDGGSSRQAPAAPRPQRTLMMVNASNGTPDQRSGAPAGVTVDSAGSKATTVKTGSGVSDGGDIYDSREFVPPNSYVRAKILVGVDMQTGVGSQSDPKPVLLRITTDAVGVGMNGQYQQTNLKGCLVNAAAWAELSSEKVYMKLQRITCQVDAHRFMTANVQGFVVSKGKAGVRGTVVSREGNLTQRAMVAGLFSGLGQAMSRNNQASLTPMATSDGGTVLGTQSLSGSQIASSTIGGGVESAANTLSQYLIKRAEQYQPVIEMGTGLNVDLVFVEGFHIPVPSDHKETVGDTQAAQNFLEQIRKR